jgi:hypothetical protein
MRLCEKFRSGRACSRHKDSNLLVVCGGLRRDKEAGSGMAIAEELVGPLLGGLLVIA